jgi:hypothetical protein
MPRLLTLVGLVLALAAVGQPRLTTAQEASPPASPIVDLSAGACVGPPTLAGTPEVRAAEPTSEATAESTGETTLQASPGPSVPADLELIARVEVAEHNLINCINAQDYATVIALHTPQALLRVFGTADPREAAAMLEGFPLSELHAVENVRVLADGRISAEVTFTVGDELMRSRDYWVDQEGALLYDGFEVLPVPDATPAP